MTSFDAPCNRAMMRVILGGYSLMGVAYLSMIARGENPVTPELFGPAVYAVPGWAWAGWQAVSGAVAAIGTLSATRSSAWLTLIGSAMLALEFAAFSVLATDAAQGEIIVLGSAFVTLPGALICAHIASLKVRRGGS